MPVFTLAGKEIHVEPYETWWPLSIFYKQQGVDVKINPERHWWCLWICQTTDDVDAIECAARLMSSIEQGTDIAGNCTRCGDLSIRSAASWGFGAPWLYVRADFTGAIVVSRQNYGFKGTFLYT